MPPSLTLTRGEGVGGLLDRAVAPGEQASRREYSRGSSVTGFTQFFPMLFAM